MKQNDGLPVNLDDDTAASTTMLRLQGLGLLAIVFLLLIW